MISVQNAARVRFWDEIDTTATEFNTVVIKHVNAHRYIVLQETGKIWHIISRPTFKHVAFLRKYKRKQFFYGHNILTEGVLVTRLSSDAESQYDEMYELP